MAVVAGRSTESLDVALESNVTDGSKQTIECEDHGASRATLICCHLRLRGRTERIGFFEGEDSEDPELTDWRCGWCSACDVVLAEEGEWNDRSEAFADAAIVCEQCFEQIAAFQKWRGR